MACHSYHLKCKFKTGSTQKKKRTNMVAYAAIQTRKAMEFTRLFPLSCWSEEIIGLAISKSFITKFFKDGAMLLNFSIPSPILYCHHYRRICLADLLRRELVFYYPQRTWLQNLNHSFHILLQFSEKPREGQRVGYPP